MLRDESEKYQQLKDTDKQTLFTGDNANENLRESPGWHDLFFASKSQISGITKSRHNVCLSGELIINSTHPQSYII